MECHGAEYSSRDRCMAMALAMAMRYVPRTRVAGWSVVAPRQSKAMGAQEVKGNPGGRGQRRSAGGARLAGWAGAWVPACTVDASLMAGSRQARVFPALDASPWTSGTGVLGMLPRPTYHDTAHDRCHFTSTTIPCLAAIDAEHIPPTAQTYR